MTFKIFTDSSADLTNEIIKDFNVSIIPLSYISNGQVYEYKGESEDDIKEFYTMLRSKDNLSTSCANEQTFIDAFEPFLKAGKDILYIGFSSGLSQTFNSALKAKQTLAEKYPLRKVMCADSLLASMGQGLMVYSICKLASQGASIEDAYDKIIKTQQNLNSIFTVKTLSHLARGGRISKLSYAVGTVVDIKPLMYVNEKGKLVAFAKVIGRRRSLVAIADKVASTIVDGRNQTVFISHGDCLNEAKTLAEMISKKVEVKQFIFNYIDPVIAVHSGPDTLAVFYYGLSREETVKPQNVATA